MVSDLTDGLAALEDSRDSYEKAQEYFHGAEPEIFASVRMRTLLARAGISYRVNFCKLPVTVLANRLRIAAVTTSDEPAQPALDRVWKANRMSLRSKVINRKVGMFGDGYGIVWPNRDNTEVTIRFNSPLTSRMIYDSEDEDTPLYLVKRWMLTEEEWRSNLYYPDHIERWFTDDKGKHWKPYVDGEDGESVVVNPFDQVPAFHWRTDMPFGVPDHFEAYGVQDAINKLVAVQMGTVDFYGFPQRAALVADRAAEDEMAREDFWEDEEDGVPGADVEGQAATIQSSPERAWILRNIKSLVQLPAGDPQVFIQPFLLFVRAMAQVTETPVRHLDPQGGVPSGESQRASDAPLTMRVNDRREMLGATYEDLCAFALRVNAHLDREAGVDETVGQDYGPVSVDVRWSPSEQTDQLDDWQVAQGKLDAGVPPKVVLVEAGYAPEQVDLWIKDSPAIELRPRVDLLVKIAQAAQGLGASSALGVVDPGLVQKAIAALTEGSSAAAA